MLVAFSITPLGTGDSVGELVAEAVRVVRAPRVSLSLKADLRPGTTDALHTKPATIERHLES